MEAVTTTKKITKIEIPYRPRPGQLELHHMLDRHRFNVFAIHRRFGKSVAVINHLIRAAILEEKPNPRFALISPSYRQSRNIAWDYLKAFTAKIPGVRYHETELRCNLPNGARITLLGSENIQSLRGIYLDGCAIDETAQCPAALFPEVIRPALSDRKGWCVFIGTPMGTVNYFYELWEHAATTPGWNRRMYRASETNVLDEEELEAARLSMSEDQYAQEFECSWQSAIPGAIYARELAHLEDKGRICEVPYRPDQFVNTYWDIGVHDYTSIILAQVGRGGEIRVIDHIEDRGHGMPHYRRLLDETGYNFQNHYAPHDIEVTEFGSGKTRRETASELGINFRIAPRLPVEDGIHAVRMMLPRCVFDRVRCKKLLEHLRHYHRAYDARSRIYRAKPVSDFAAHSADAMRYMSVAITDIRDERIPRQKFAEGAYNPFEVRA